MTTQQQPYKITLQHDNGTYKIIVYATNIIIARETILAVENCPDRAIVAIQPL